MDSSYYQWVCELSRWLAFLMKRTVSLKIEEEGEDDKLNRKCLSGDIFREADKKVLKHPVLIRWLIDYCFMHVPMLYDLAILESENVDDGGAPCPGYPHRVYMQDHVVSICKYLLYLTV